MKAPSGAFFLTLLGKMNMKNLKKLICLISILFFSFSAFAYDHTIKTQTSFIVAATLVEKKFEDTILNPEGFLKRFNPVGVQVIKKVIKGNEFEYVVVKKILGISKTFHLLGSIAFERSLIGCAANQRGYLAHIDFTASGPSVTDTIEDFTLLFCGTDVKVNQLAFKSINTLYYKGDKFGSLLERFAQSLMSEQVEALTASMRDETILK